MKVDDLNKACNDISPPLSIDLCNKLQNANSSATLSYNPFLDSIEIGHEKTERTVSTSADSAFKLFIDDNKSLIKKCLGSSYAAAILTSVKIDISSDGTNTLKNKSLSQGLFVEFSALNDKVPAQMADWLLHRAKSEMLHFALTSYKEQLANDSVWLGVSNALFPGTWMHLGMLDDGSLELGALRRTLRSDMDDLPKNMLRFLSDTAQLLTMVNGASQNWHSTNCIGTKRIGYAPPACKLFDRDGYLINQDSLKVRIKQFTVPIHDVSIWADGLEAEFLKSSPYFLIARLSQDSYVEAWVESMKTIDLTKMKGSSLDSVYAVFSNDGFSLSGAIIVEMTKIAIAKMAMQSSVPSGSANDWELNQLESILLKYANSPGLKMEKRARIKLGIAWLNARNRSEYAPFLMATSQYLEQMGLLDSLDSGMLNYSRIGSKLREGISGMRMLAGLAQAKDSIELTNWMNQIAAPVGSYRLKRKFKGLGLNAYVGYSWGGSYAGTVHLEQKSITPHLNIGLVNSLSPGIDLYLGLVEFATAISKREMIHGLDSSNRTIEWSDVFVPSLAVQWGLGRTPFAVGLGVQHMGVAAEEPKKIRPFMHLSVDMPILWVRRF